jgi:SAM-dependent methyltransferase
VLAALAALAEILSRRTITFSLGLPLSLGLEARILDYGCGSGDWLLNLAHLGYRRLCGVDIESNRASLGSLRENGISTHAISELDGLPDESFDIVRLEHVLEHLPHPVSTLAGLRRLISRGGWLVVTVPSILPWMDRDDLDRSGDRAHLQIPMHLAHHSDTSLTQLIRESGFAVVSLKKTRIERFLTVAARRSADGDSK